MSNAFNVALYLLLLGVSITWESQETSYSESESTKEEFFQLIDSIPLTLNESFCVEEISVELLASASLEVSHRGRYYVRIAWESKNFMESVKLESDSLNDSYCEANNKHYYYRKPLNQSVHIFPDEVNEGIRFLPIKLDCKYIITPELEGPCRPFRLRYLTPVCIDNETCSCRNVNMSGPNIEGTLDDGGINVFWSFPQGFHCDVSSVVISIYSEEGINSRKLEQKKVSTSNRDQRGTRFSQYFQVNSTTESLLRVQGYFENSFGCRGNSTFVLIQRTERTQRLSNEEILPYALASAFLLVPALACLLYFRKRPMQRVCRKLFPPALSEPSGLLPPDAVKNIPMVWNSTYVSQNRDSNLFDYRNLRIVREIASGNFGVVYLAYSFVSLGGCNEFAIKQIKDEAGPEGVTDFMEEIKMFRLVGEHQNVVRMFGYCSAPQPLTIIMEYVPFNLLAYLKTLRVQFEMRKWKNGNSVTYAKLSHSRSSSDDQIEYNYISQNEVESQPLHDDYRRKELEYVLDSRELEVFGLQIANGMAHLESRNIVHGDLAARNVLMDNAKVLKISDFGMSKTGIYVSKRPRKFPLRWMSPEALVNRAFTNKSDVWAFGVVLWEIGTLGAFPYSSLQNEEVVALLRKGGHLDRPENVTAGLYALMVDCWAHSPDDRPSFRCLVDKIGGFCQESNGYVEFENLESNHVFPPVEDDMEKK